MVKKKTALCPTCGALGEFEWIGDQHWPEPVAKRLGLPAVIGLWSCPNCHTTVSEVALKGEDRYAPIPAPKKPQTGPLKHG